MSRHDTRAFKPMSAEDELRLAAAGVGGRKSAGLPPSNWGKSFTSRNDSVENQLVRVQLPRSTDLTLYLQPMRGLNGLPSVDVDYHVTVGTGGIALLSQWVPAPVYGAARHYVADVLEVSVITPGATVIPRIVAANAALGRLNTVVEPGGHVGTSTTPFSVPASAMANLLTKRPDSHAWSQVEPGTCQLFRIPPFATHVQMRVRANNGAADSEMIVFGVGTTGGGAIEGLVSDFALPTPMAPDIPIYGVQCTNANPLVHFDVSMSFTITQ